MRIRRFLIAFASYFLWYYISVFTFLLGLTTVPLTILVGSFLGILVCNISIYAIIRTGFNKRFKDPSLTLLQIVAATFWIMVILYYADSVRSAMLLLYLVVFIFGLFRLNVWQFLFLSVLAAVNYAAVIFLLYKFHPESINIKIEVLNVVILATVLPWFSLVGGYITRLRAKISNAFSSIERMADNIQDVIFVVDMNLKYTYVSPSVKLLRGYEPEEVMKQAPFDAIMPSCLEMTERTLSEVMALEKSGRDLSMSRTLQLEIKRKDGATLWTETKVSLVRDKNRQPVGFLGVMRDITERRQMEESLRRSEDKYRSILENMQDPYYEQDLAGNYTFVNDAMCKHVGYSKEELLDMNYRQLQNEEAAKKIYQTFNEVYRTGEPIKALACEYIRKDGIKGFAELSISLMRDAEGKPVGFWGISHDITERKQAEEEKRNLEERLNRAEKMEALGQLAGGVAHDLNNVLGILSGYSELLLLEIPEGQKARSHAEKILKSTEKGAAIIQDLLTLARRGVTVSDVVNLNNVISDYLKTPVFDIVKDNHPRVSFKTECQDDLLNIKGSPVHLEKTLMNLVSNAAESISGKGEVMIRTENRYLDKPISGYDEIKEGDYAVLSVADTGMGIPAEHIKKIFEPFYTKKAMGRSGTGLGLAIVWGTVKDHHGYIDLQTKVGEGTTFTLYFPVTRDELTAPQQMMPIEQYMGNGESVLVVDDIAEQRDVASGLLTKLGYEVHTVSGGEEAVEYLKSNMADILVLDMIMAPGLDGFETYQRILAINPKQRAIIVSGFSETDRVRNAQKLGAGSYIRKPYMMEKIGLAIRNELKR